MDNNLYKIKANYCTLISYKNERFEIFIEFKLFCPYLWMSHIALINLQFNSHLVSKFTSRTEPHFNQTLKLYCVIKNNHDVVTFFTYYHYKVIR